MNTVMPAANRVRGPTRSPSRPAVMTSTASTRAYAFITQSTSSNDACSLVIMLGMAMLTIVKSSNVMKNPSEMTTSTAHGFPRNLRMLSPRRQVLSLRRGAQAVTCGMKGLTATCARPLKTG